MEIKKTAEICGGTLRKLRESRGERLEDFWGAVGYSTSRGSAYETGSPIPEHVRRLIFLHYVVGIPTDLQGSEVIDLATAVENGSARRLEEARALLVEQQELLVKSLHVLGGGNKVQLSEEDQLLADARGWIVEQEDGTTLAAAARHLSVSRPQARRVLNQLVSEGLLEKPARGTEHYPGV